MTGDNNQCPTCGERFKSVRGFAAHRIGEFGGVGTDGIYRLADRKCKTPAAMAEAGMQRNAWGMWITKAFAERLR